MIAALALRGAVFALVWWVLAEGRADSWGVGAASIVLALAVSLKLAPPCRVRPASFLSACACPQDCHACSR